jgi:hypothetical protein
VSRRTTRRGQRHADGDRPGRLDGNAVDQSKFVNIDGDLFLHRNGELLEGPENLGVDVLQAGATFCFGAE